MRTSVEPNCVESHGNPTAPDTPMLPLMRSPSHHAHKSQQGCTYAAARERTLGARLAAELSNCVPSPDHKADRRRDGLEIWTC